MVGQTWKNRPLLWLLHKPQKDLAHYKGWYFVSCHKDLRWHGREHHYWGKACPIGKSGFIKTFVATKVDEWISEIDTLSEFADSQPHAAYSALTHGLTSTQEPLVGFSSHLKQLYFFQNWQGGRLPVRKNHPSCQSWRTKHQESSSMLTWTVYSLCTSYWTSCRSNYITKKWLPLWSTWRSVNSQEWSTTE